MNFKIKSWTNLQWIVSLFILLGSGCIDDIDSIETESETIKDIDGNVYHTIRIGKQVWLMENLKVSRYNNGDSIHFIKIQKDWCDTKEGAYSCYNSNTANSNIYGNLYNWYAVNDNRKIAPKGFHIPSIHEVLDLVEFCEGCVKAGVVLKEEGNTHWDIDSPLSMGTNEFGFTALPGGCRTNDKIQEFEGIRILGSWWTNSTYKQDTAWYLSIFNYDLGAKVKCANNSFGFSVRCIKD